MYFRIDLKFQVPDVYEEISWRESSIPLLSDILETIKEIASKKNIPLSWIEENGTIVVFEIGSDNLIKDLNVYQVNFDLNV